MRTFVWSVVIFFGLFTLIKLLSTAAEEKTKVERMYTVVDTLITMLFFAWGIAVLVHS